jgi:polyvinyl alcohol dehydrogenase (cytochrome)
MWGAAADKDRVYVANSDLRFLPDGTMSLDPAAGGGLFALDLSSGIVSTQVLPVLCGDRSQCSPRFGAMR